MTETKKIPAAILFLLSFLEGGCVMATELAGARVLAPMFGTSLYVWSAVLAITLCGLAVGYFAGGKLSAGKNPLKRLMYVLVLSGIFMICMPVLGRFMNLFAFHFSLLPAVTISALLILFPPLMFMGMVSPLIIHQLISESKGGGKRSGEVYAISTTGGIIFTFLTGFWLLPAFGNAMPLLFLGLLLMAVPLFYLVRGKYYLQSLILFAFTVFCSWTNLKNQQKKPYVLYESEGILGKIEVVDFERTNAETGEAEHPRYLLVNNIVQTNIDLLKKDWASDYTGTIDGNVMQTGGAKKKALILGLGGGIVSNIFLKKGYSVKAVEIDTRIKDAALNYFFLDPRAEVVIDDARNFLNRCNEKFDVIMIDVFRGEVTPYYVFTKESMTKMKSLLNKDGEIIVNTYGYLDNVYGAGNVSILNTFTECGLSVDFCGTGPTVEKRNLIIFASEKPRAKPLKGYSTEKINFSSAPVQTDGHCTLDVLNAPTGKLWRELYIRNFILQRQ